METKINWPHGAQCAVMLSFDVDGETLFTEGPDGSDWYYPRSVAFGRYGPRRGVDHILNILEREQVKATFFIPGRTAERYPEMVKAVDASGLSLIHISVYVYILTCYVFTVIRCKKMIESSRLLRLTHSSQRRLYAHYLKLRLTAFCIGHRSVYCVGTYTVYSYASRSQFYGCHLGNSHH